MNLKGRNFLKLLDYTSEEILGLIDFAAELKEKKKKGVPHEVLKGKNIAGSCLRPVSSSARAASR